MKNSWKALALCSLVALAAAMPALALTQTNADNLATSILSQGGRTKGICELPRVETGELALSFVHRSGMIVHAMNPDTASVRAARSMLDAEGFVGIRAYVEKGTPAAIPLADNYADLLVITDVTAADLSSMPVAEIVRALGPGGKAFVGRAVSEGAGATASDLQNWITGRSDASVTTDAQGTWAIITKSVPARIDEWTHAQHGPDNNTYSNDSVAAWPYMPQWRQKPYSGIERNGTVVTANGRAYQVQNFSHGALTQLRAIRIYSGQVLWKKDVGAQTGAYAQWVPSTKFSFMVAQGNTLYLVNRNKVDKLDGETGALTGSITCDAVTKNEVKWIAIDNGILYALTGDTALYVVRESGWQKFYYGTTLSAYNLSSGAQVWTHTETGNIDSRAVGINSGKLYYFIHGSKVVALNSATGASVWAVTASATMTAIDAVLTTETYDYGNASGFICSPTTLLIGQCEQSNLTALSATDGSLLWSTARNGNFGQPKVLLGNGVLLASSITDATKTSWNVVTNQVVPQYQNISLGGGCGMLSASPDGVFGNAGGQGHCFPLNKDLPAQIFKTTCGIAMFVSNGMAFNPNNTTCTCLRGNRAFVAEAPAGSFAFDQQAVQATRLESGPASGNIDAQVTVDASDWSTHRANIARSGCLAVDLPTQHNLIWRYLRRHAYNVTLGMGADTMDQENSPPVTAGSLVFWGGTDGYVRCFDEQTKAERWSFATGGRILATPTVANGCVYVGSMDGYAYCIEAVSGRLVWRFRAAPVQRRINYYGSLASTWPVNSGVIVQNGNAYFAAGTSEGTGYGTYVYALNASTGTIVWQNTTNGSRSSQSNLTLQCNACGYMTIVGSRLWVTANTQRAGLFELADGRFDSLSGDLGGSHGGAPAAWGREIGILDATHMYLGGRMQFADNNERAPGGKADCFLQIDANGQPRYPESALSTSSSRAPAWDNASFFTAGDQAGSLAKWSLSSLVSNVDATRAAHTPSSYQWWQQMQEALSTTGLVQWTNSTDMDLNGIALANNGVVALNAHRVNNSDPPTNWTWYVSIVSRANGSVTWQTQLRGAPAHEGLAIDRNGSIIVSMANGDLYCYGAGPAVSVADAYPENPAVEASPEALATMPTSAATRSVSLTDDRHSHSGAISVHPSSGVVFGDNPRGEFASFPPSDKVAVTTDGQSLPLQQIPQGARTAALYTPRDMTWRPEHACLPVTSVNASSWHSADRPANTIDRMLTSRWQPASDGTQWIAYDLGRVRTVEAATIVWYSPRSADVPFTVETSCDGKSYVKTDAGCLSGRGTTTTLRTFAPVETRWVRLSIQAKDVTPSVYEVGIHAGMVENQARAR
jgi:outer membrane protein assembly factor BamB